jgi:hypothetical protein
VHRPALVVQLRELVLELGHLEPHDATDLVLIESAVGKVGVAAIRYVPIARLV